MNKKLRLYIDQYGQQYFAHTVKELREQIENGGSRVNKMYQDIGNEVFHIGYVIGNHWLQMYAPRKNKTIGE